LRLIAALLLMFPGQVIPFELNPQWWWQVGYCTATDRAELGGCGTLELREIDWGK